MAELVVAGIDPGKTGALAIIGSVVEVWDLPWIGKDLDIQMIASWLKPYRENAALSLHMAIESQQGLRGQGITSINTLMFGYGQLVGFCLGAGIPLTTVRPMEWKGAMGIPSGAKLTPAQNKERSKAIARRLFPLTDLGTRQDQGRSDALLIAERVRRMLTGG